MCFFDILCAEVFSSILKKRLNTVIIVAVTTYGIVCTPLCLTTEMVFLTRLLYFVLSLNITGYLLKAIFVFVWSNKCISMFIRLIKKNLPIVPFYLISSIESFYSWNSPAKLLSVQYSTNWWHMYICPRNLQICLESIYSWFRVEWNLFCIYEW